MSNDIANESFLTPTVKQKEVMDRVLGRDIVYRHPRSMGLTIEQINTFNHECADGEKRIQWYNHNWVAMDRKSFNELVKKAGGL